jgi:hypothetical protein
METLDEFFAANETIERDPVKWLNRLTEQTCERILPPDLPPDLRVALLRSRLSTLHARGKDAIESGRAYLITDAVSDFGNDLRGALAYERASGALKPWRREDEIKKFAGRGDWERHLYNAHEVICAQQLLPEGAHILAVGWHGVTTDKGEIPRGEYESLRPVSTSRAHWESLNTPGHVIQVAIEREKYVERERNRPFSEMSGPSVRPR